MYQQRINHDAQRAMREQVAIHYFKKCLNFVKFRNNWDRERYLEDITDLPILRLRQFNNLPINGPTLSNLLCANPKLYVSDIAKWM